MSNAVVNEHRFSVAPELIPGSRWQPYDPETDRPSTTTEGAHLAQYYSNAWLAACKAGEQLQERAEQEIYSIEQQMTSLQQDVVQLTQDRDHEKKLLANAVKRAQKAEYLTQKRELKDILIGGLVGFIILGGLGLVIGLLIGTPVA